MAEDKSLLDAIYQNAGYKTWFSLGLDGVKSISAAKTASMNQKSEASQYSLMASTDKVNSDLMIQNQDSITHNYQQQLNQVRMNAVKLKGEQEAAMSANGFEVNSGSYVDMTNQTDFLAAQTVAALTAQYGMDVAKNKFQADCLQIQSALEQVKSEITYKMAKNTAKYGAISGALQAVASVAGAYGQYKYNNPSGKTDINSAGYGKPYAQPQQKSLGYDIPLYQGQTKLFS